MKRTLNHFTKFVCGVLVALLTLSTVTVFAATNTTKQISVTSGNINLVVNGKHVIPKDAAGNVVEPFLYDGTVFVPLRAVAEALNMDPTWDSATTTATLTSKTPAATLPGNPTQPAVPYRAGSVKQITVTSGSINLVINGTHIIPKDAAGNVVQPCLYDGTVFVPLRAVAEALGMEPAWDSATSTATLTSRSPAATLPAAPPTQPPTTLPAPTPEPPHTTLPAPAPEQPPTTLPEPYPTQPPTTLPEPAPTTPVVPYG